jgi:hypothetical protein
VGIGNVQMSNFIYYISFCGSDVEKSLLRVGAIQGVAPSMIGCLPRVTCKDSGEFSCDDGL